MNREVADAIRGSFGVVGSSFAKWYKENGFCESTAKSALYGINRGEKSREILKKAHRDAICNLRQALKIAEEADI
jgi:hypothetical protein